MQDVSLKCSQLHFLICCPAKLKHILREKKGLNVVFKHILSFILQKGSIVCPLW